MSSVTNNFMNCRPLCTRKLQPMKSGTIVQSRAQVLIGSRLPRDCRSTFLSSFSSTYGPFLSDRLMPLLASTGQKFYKNQPFSAIKTPRNRCAHPGACNGSLILGVVRAGTAAANDRLVRRLPLLTRLAALGQNARRSARVPAAGGAAFAAAHRVADRVLRRAAVVRLAAHPALAARLAQGDVHVIGVADDADGRPAIHVHAAHFARRQRHLRPAPFAARSAA